MDDWTCQLDHPIELVGGDSSLAECASMPGTEWTLTHGKKLRALRESKGFSQFRLAVEAGVDSAVVSKYENAERHPRAMVLFKLARALGVTMEQILEPGLNSLGHGASERRLSKSSALRLERR